MILLALPALAAHPKLLSPTFAWPAGMDVVVRATTEVRTDPPGAGPKVTETGWRVHTAAVADGLRVWRTDLADARVLEPAVVVDASGRLVRMEGEQARVREDWNRLVETWVGATFEVGKPHEWTQVRALPLLGLVSATSTLRAAWEGAVACPGRRGRHCAALTLTVAPTDTSVTEAARLQLEQARKEDPAFLAGFTVTAAHLAESLSLVVDPATLLPYREVHATEQSTEGEGPAGATSARTWTTTTVTWSLPTR